MSSAARLDRRPETCEAFGVIRELDPSCLHQFREIFDGIEGIQRGAVFGDHSPALNLLMKHAVRLEAHGSYDTNEVQQMLYENISSLRKPLKFQIGSIGKFVTKSAMRLAIVPDNETCEALKEESARIIDTAAMNLHDFRFYNIGTNNIPHISGIKLPAGTKQSGLMRAQKRAYENMEQLPTKPTLKVHGFTVV